MLSRFQHKLKPQIELVTGTESEIPNWVLQGEGEVEGKMGLEFVLFKHKSNIA